MTCTKADLDWAWAAGLFEGEGCISRHPTRGGFQRTLRLGSTDEDVVRRFHEIVGAGNICLRPSKEGKTKPHKVLWIWQAGRWPDVARILEGFLPFFGTRRREKAEEMLADPPRQRHMAQRSRTATHCGYGHRMTPDNTLRYSGRNSTGCRQCHRDQMREYRQRRKETT